MKKETLRSCLARKRSKTEHCRLKKSFTEDPHGRVEIPHGRVPVAENKEESKSSKLGGINQWRSGVPGQ